MYTWKRFCWALGIGLGHLKFSGHLAVRVEETIRVASGKAMSRQASLEFLECVSNYENYLLQNATNQQIVEIKIPNICTFRFAWTSRQFQKIISSEISVNWVDFVRTQVVSISCHRRRRTRLSAICLVVMLRHYGSDSAETQNGSPQPEKNTFSSVNKNCAHPLTAENVKNNMRHASEVPWHVLNSHRIIPDANSCWNRFANTTIKHCHTPTIHESNLNVPRCWRMIFC